MAGPEGRPVERLGAAGAAAELLYEQRLVEAEVGASWEEVGVC